jgi:hypothetical protein
VVEEDGAVRLRRPPFDLESVIGSIPALPDESLDLEREIQAATEEEMRRVKQRWRENSRRRSK